MTKNSKGNTKDMPTAHQPKSNIAQVALEKATPTKQNINVTKPLLPEKDRVIAALDDLYESGVITNMGPFHQKLEGLMHQRLGGEAFLLFSNGTIALMAALSALDLPPGSEVITTPFSFAATTHAITALGLKPVFADIDPIYMTICPRSIEQRITKNTSCILGVHVYGYPCDVLAIDAIANAKNLKVVYDCAHAFDVTVGQHKISHFGDASAYSFHATKLFNTVEGGGLVLNKPQNEQLARDYRNFGIRSEDHVATAGLNGKMSEIHALFGLLNLEILSDEIEKRKAVAQTYNSLLGDCPHINIATLPSEVQPSYQYFPITISNYRDHVYERLKDHGVFSRRYFYPLIADFDCYKDNPSTAGLPSARRAAKEVLCLPYYGQLSDGSAERIAGHITDILNTVTHV